ncbi:unnamed protein product [Protopolystoma xenopodis]|uniref:Uncharacterized protein n=1 Tax=Protopolystoma xenopodis TaxID=117903 RepID=A0A448XBY1_9PLAT|nr:unnamed protein product [Protopolystoma xenopodis]
MTGVHHCRFRVSLGFSEASSDLNHAVLHFDTSLASSPFFVALIDRLYGKVTINTCDSPACLYHLCSTSQVATTHVPFSLFQGPNLPDLCFTRRPQVDTSLGQIFLISNSVSAVLVPRLASPRYKMRITYAGSAEPKQPISEDPDQ